LIERTHGKYEEKQEAIQQAGLVVGEGRTDKKKPGNIWYIEIPGEEHLYKNRVMRLGRFEKIKEDFHVMRKITCDDIAFDAVNSLVNNGHNGVLKVLFLWEISEYGCLGNSYIQGNFVQ